MWIIQVGYQNVLGGTLGTTVFGKLGQVNKSVQNIGPLLLAKGSYFHWVT